MAGFRDSFSAVLALFSDPKAEKKRLGDFNIREVQMFLGDLQRRCVNVKTNQFTGEPEHLVADDTFVRLTKDDVRYLWAAEQYLAQYEIVRVEESQRSARRGKH